MYEVVIFIIKKKLRCLEISFDIRTGQYDHKYECKFFLMCIGSLILEKGENITLHVV